MNPINRHHLLLILIASFPVFWVSLVYMDAISGYAISGYGNEEFATAITICFFAFLYTGRFIVHVWTERRTYIPAPFYLVLAGIIGICTLWLFIYPDIDPLQSFPATRLFLYWFPFILLSIALGAFITMIRFNHRQLKEVQLSATQSQTELKLLQSQISPHFLFNTLNNLYGISIKRHEMLPPLLLKLSDLLRYSVYEAKELFVPLQDEVAYIKNYLEFEKLRLGDRLIIKADFAELPGEMKIAPMILIIFVENAIKHSKNSADQHISIEMELKTWADTILFSVVNSYQKNDQEKSPKNYKGFGYENVKTRLALLYPGQNDLKIETGENFYKVMLLLKTK